MNLEQGYLFGRSREDVSARPARRRPHEPGRHHVRHDARQEGDGIAIWSAISRPS
jgi:hypothetical protein